MKNTNEKDILERYYKAKLTLELAEQTVKNLSEELTDFLLKQDDYKAETPEAKFTLRKDVVYKFSAEVTKKEADLKVAMEKAKEKLDLQKEIVKTMQETEIKTGQAKAIETKFRPVMIPVKEK